MTLLGYDECVFIYVDLDKMRPTQTVLVIMGPTGIGKTKLAMALSNQIPIEIISVDSVMVYKDCSIGCAKPSKEELSAYPHHLIDLCEHNERYDVARFLQDCQVCIESIQKKGHIPCLVGGTMMYFNAAKNGIADIPPIDPENSILINEKAQKDGWASLWKNLNEIDSVSAKRINPNDSQRIERALNVYYTHQKPLSYYWQYHMLPAIANKHWQWLSVYPSRRELLYQNINARFDDMLDQGFLNEAKAILAKTPVMTPGIRKAVGYRHAFDFLEGKITENEMRIKATQATRHLAKRQITWMQNKWPDVNRVSDDILQEKYLISHIKNLCCTGGF